MEPKDPLARFIGLCTCPACGCLDKRGVYRCAECGTFHAGAIMEEREPPPPEATVESLDAQLIDPSNYSLGPNAALPEESFEESEAVRSWGGGSSDFSFEDDDPPLKTMIEKLPVAEEIDEPLIDEE